jgi:hypothetical protein
VGCKKSPAEPENLSIIEKVLVAGRDFMMGNTPGNGSRDQLPPIWCQSVHFINQSMKLPGHISVRYG